MNKLLGPFLVPALGGGLIAAAFAGQPGPDPTAPPKHPARCFRAADVNGWSPRGDDEVDVRVGPSRQYRLTLVGPCPDVDWSFRVAIRTRSGSSWICQGADAELIVPSPTGTQRCLVSDVRQLNEAEIEAARRDRR